MLIIGSHVSFGKEQLLGSVKEALSYNANTFMFYTGAPQNTIRKEIDKETTQKALDMMKTNNIDINNVICHAPYIVNLANNSDESKYTFSKDFIKKELIRCDEMGVTKMVLHPGSAVKVTREDGLNNIINSLNEILDGSTKCKVLLETMAGKGNELGINLDEMKVLIDGIKNKNQIGICIDTCHINDAGYDIQKFDDYLNELDKKIGLSYVECIHINDSKNEIGAHKDRHENIGIGTIGFDNLLNVIYNSKLENIPKILETPYIGDTDDSKERLYPPYKYEIEMIKNKKFNQEFLNDIRKEYQ